MQTQGITRYIVVIIQVGNKRRCRPKNRSMVSVKDDMCMKGVNNEMTADRDEWMKTYCVDPNFFEYDSIQY